MYTRTGQLADYSAENVGFRCAESSTASDGMQEPHLWIRRKPVHHRLTDTYEFKVKRDVMRDAVKVTDEL